MLEIGLTFKHLSITCWPHRQHLGMSGLLNYFQHPLYCGVLCKSYELCECANSHVVNNSLDDDDGPTGQENPLIPLVSSNRSTKKELRVNSTLAPSC